MLSGAAASIAEEVKNHYSGSNMDFYKRGIEIPVLSSTTIAFRAEVKAMLLAAVEKSEWGDRLRDDEPLFGKGSRLNLDSLDGLQISMEI